MIFRFYIFGTPDGFDLYQGTTEESGYFRKYDEGSKENVKLAIERIYNDVSYSYLRYNLVSGAGQKGAFFGMSVVMKDMYCTDITSLYELFDKVYINILHNGILLKETPDGQTVFNIRTFRNSATEIVRINKIVINNLNNAFANDFKALDKTFKRDANPNILPQLRITKGNETILAAMKKYSMILVSSEYTDIFVIPTTKEMNRMESIVNDIQQEVFVLQTELNDINTLILLYDAQIDEQQKIETETEIKKIYNNLTGSADKLFNKCLIEQKTIKQYLQNQPEYFPLQILSNNLEKIKNELTELIKSANTILSKIKQFKKEETTNKKDKKPVSTHSKFVKSVIENNINDETNDNEPKPDPEILNLDGKNKNKDDTINGNNDNKDDTISGNNDDKDDKGKHKKQKIIVGIFVIVVGMLIYFITQPDNKCPECSAILHSADSLLALVPPQYDNAIEKYKEVAKKDTNINVSDKLANAKNIAVQHIKKTAEREFNKTGRKKMDSYNIAITELEKIENYEGNSDEEKENYKKQTIDYYFQEIDKGGRTKAKKEEYAEYILQLDPNNEKAKKIIDENQDDGTLSPKPCILNFAEQEKTVDQWLELVKNNQDIDKTYVINCCKAIIEKAAESNSCVTSAQKQKATELQKQMESPKPDPIPTCEVTFSGKQWKVDDLLKQLEKDLERDKANISDFVKKGCEEILKSACITNEQKNRAMVLKEKTKPKTM